MKAILYSLMVVALVGGMVGGGLFAYFSDTETSTGNTFTAGTIDIEVSQASSVFSDGAQIEFKPCETGYITITVTNVGQNPADVYKLVEAATGGEGTMSEPECVACGGTWDAGACTGATAVVPGTDDFYFDLVVDNVVVIAPDTVLLSAVVGKYISLGELAPGVSMVIEQSLHLIDSGVAQNELQGDIMTLDEQFAAFQVPGDAGPSPLY